MRIDSAKIKQLRMEQGLSRSELARKTGVSGPTLKRIEDDVLKRSHGPTIRKLANYFEVKPIELLIVA